MRKLKQVEQSKSWFLAALLELMKEKSYGLITITEISEKAQLDRRTFYRHFNSKEDVLKYYINNLLLVHFQEIKRRGLIAEEAMMCQHFYFLKEHFAFFKLLKEQHLFSFILESFPEYNQLFETVFKTDPFVETEGDYRAAFKVGGFLNAVSCWMEQQEPESPEVMAKIITDFYHCGLEKQAGTDTYKRTLQKDGL